MSARPSVGVWSLGAAGQQHDVLSTIITSTSVAGSVNGCRQLIEVILEAGKSHKATREVSEAGAW